MRLRKEDAGTVISFQYLQRSTPFYLSKMFPAFLLTHAYLIPGCGQSHGCTYRNLVTGLFCPVSMGTRDRPGSPGPEHPSWLHPWGCCLWTCTHRSFVPWDHPSYPSTACLLIPSFPAGRPPRHTTHSLKTQRSTFHTPSWGRGQ